MKEHVPDAGSYAPVTPINQNVHYGCDWQRTVQDDDEYHIPTAPAPLASSKPWSACLSQSFPRDPTGPMRLS
jgi:hypothetical protein